MMQQQAHAATLMTLVRALLTHWWLILSRDPVSIVEIIFGAWAALWGVFLFGAWDAFATPGWALVRATHIPETAFGAWFLVWGLAQAIEVPSRWGRIAAAFVLMVTWGLIALALLWTTPATTGTAIYPVFALVEVYLFLRLASAPRTA
jgi:hypothetical protein